MAISIVGTVTGTSGAGTQANPNVTLPTVQDNDLGILLVSAASVATPTDPAGWTARGTVLVSGSILSARIYTKTLTAADSSTTVSETLAATKWTTICIVLRGAETTLDGIVSGPAQTSNTTSLTIPAITPVADDCLLVAPSGIRLSTATTPQYTAASGWTEQADLTGGASPCNSAALATKQLTGQAGVAQGPDTATLGNASQIGTFTIAVAPVVVGGGSAGTFGDTLVKSLNRIAGTTGLEAAGAANAYAGTTGLEVVGALNVAAGNALPNYKDLTGVLNQLAGTTGLEADAAAASIVA